MLIFRAMENLRLFCDVVQHRSFSEAAGVHGITQSAASQRISSLERQLGVQLFDRSVRPPALTEAGQLFLEGCTDLLGRYDRLTQRLREGASTLRGVVRVDAIYSAGIAWLQQVREGFEQLHKTVRVVVSYRRPEEVHDSVMSNHCDLGIVSYPRQWRDVAATLLREEAMGVVCRPDHPLASRELVRAGELAEWSLVSFENDLPVGRQIRQYLREHDAHTKVTNAFDNIDTIKSVVAVTEQIAILPLRTVRREGIAGVLTGVRLEPTLTRPMGLITRRRRKTSPAQSPAVQQFIDYLRVHTTEDDAAADAAVATARTNGA